MRRDISRADDLEVQARLLDTVLDKVLGLGLGVGWGSGAWAKGGALSAEWTRRSGTGEALRPRRVWQGPRGAVMPVFFDDQGKRLGVGKGRRAAARVVEWLRRTEQRLALLAPGYKSRATRSTQPATPSLWGPPAPKVKAPEGFEPNRSN